MRPALQGRSMPQSCRSAGSDHLPVVSAYGNAGCSESTRFAACAEI
jgi:hypothetical protein